MVKESLNISLIKNAEPVLLHGAAHRFITRFGNIAIA